MKVYRVRKPVDENALRRDYTFDGHVCIFVVPRLRIMCVADKQVQTNDSPRETIYANPRGLSTILSKVKTQRK